MDRAVEILTAYVSNPSTHLAPEKIGEVYKSIRDALKEDMALNGGEERSTESRPAVSPKKSVTDDHIVCLSCGGNFKSLKRHLSQKHGLTPEQYREKWNLPADYPMVAADYSKQRSDLAYKNGLGDLRKKAKT